MQNQALRADVLMLLTAIIWGSAFVAQRLGMDHIGPFLYTGLRFALAALVLLPLLAYTAAKQTIPGEPWSNRGLLFGGAMMGLVLALGINLQQVGLLFTSVTNSGFITGLYVIIVPLIGLFIGHKTGIGIWLGAISGGGRHVPAVRRRQLPGGLRRLAATGRRLRLGHPCAGRRPVRQAP